MSKPEDFAFLRDLFPVLYKFTKIQKGETVFETLTDHYGDPCSLDEMKDVARKILEACDKLTTEEIVLLRAQWLNKIHTPSGGPHASPKHKSVKGWVYVLKGEGTGTYKIGKTTNLKARQKWFELHLPFKVSNVCSIATDDCGGLEESLHERFSEKRVNGEWFKLNEEDLQHLKSLTGN